MSISELPVSRSDCNWFSRSRVYLHCRVPCCCSVQGVPRGLTCYSVMSKDAGSWSWFLTVSECLTGSVHVWFFTSLLHFWHSLIWLNTCCRGLPQCKLPYSNCFKGRTSVRIYLTESLSLDAFGAYMPL